MYTKLEIGDIAQLKSGGPEMAVEGYDFVVDPDGTTTVSEFVICRWFDGKKDQRKAFHQDTLVKA